MAKLNVHQLVIESLEEYLYHADHNFRIGALTRSNIQDHHIDVALKDPHVDVRIHAVKICNLNPHHISTALEDPSPYVREAVHFHHGNKLSDDDITKGIHDSSSIVRLYAIANEKAKSHHIDMALKSTDPLVRQHAVSHPNATYEQSKRGLSDPDYHVREMAEIMLADRDPDEEKR